MEAYIYQAAWYCVDCAMEIRERRAKEIPNFDAEDYERRRDLYESNTYPAGPYADGGGVSDCPECCDGCEQFLENPLTQTGYDYLRGMLIDALTTPPEKQHEVISEWAEFYEASLSIDPIRIELDGGS